VQGSGRSIAVFHLLEALESMPDLFTKFGGHRQAAGLTFPVHRLEEFRERFRAYAALRLTPLDFERELAIDGTIEFNEIDDRAVEDILRLAPFGQGNAAPVFAALGVEVAAPADIKNEKHLFLRLRAQGRMVRMKAWNFADRAGVFTPGAKVDVAFSFEEDTYSAERGYAPWQAIVKDVIGR
jgi:single-stranded-DNA-specific exonuclease